MTPRSQFFIVLATVAAAAGFVRLAEPAPSASPSALTAAGEQWTDVTGFITKAAEQVPESSYAYKPTPAVRSFGALIGHIAGTQNYMCGMALGVKAGAEDGVEKTTTAKAALIDSLKASNALCKKAYAISDANAAKTMKMFGEEKSGLYWLMSNMGHDNLHYGNIITYMRMLGMTPPSSQSAP